MNETELLFTEVLGLNRADLYLERNKILSREDRLKVRRALERRLAGEPLEYILGHTEFMGMDFEVNPDVLVPRPETELLVEAALKYATNSPYYRISKLNILDIGTGSGCIAVTLAKLVSESEIVAVDISQAALNVAISNARKNGVIQKIEFLYSDLFSSPRLKPGSFDLIVSNPPYIKTKLISELEPEVRRQPHVALDGGREGLDAHLGILRQAPVYLKPGGLLLLEIGFDQKETLKKILSYTQIFEVKEIIKDYNNIDRVMVLNLKEKNG